MTFSELVSTFAQALEPDRSLGDVPPESVRLVKEDFEIAFRYFDFCDYASVVVRVALLPAAGVKEFMAEMLRSNFSCVGTGGGTFSINDDGYFYFQMSAYLPPLTKEKILAGMDEFLSVLREWHDLAKAYDDAYSDESGSSSVFPDNPLAPLSSPGFLRV